MTNAYNVYQGEETKSVMVKLHYQKAGGLCIKLFKQPRITVRIFVANDVSTTYTFAKLSMKQRVHFFLACVSTTLYLGGFYGFSYNAY